MKRLYGSINIYFFGEEKAPWTDQALYYGTIVGSALMAAAAAINITM